MFENVIAKLRERNRPLMHEEKTSMCQEIRNEIRTKLNEAIRTDTPFDIDRAYVDAQNLKTEIWAS